MQAQIINDSLTITVKFYKNKKSIRAYIPADLFQFVFNGDLELWEVLSPAQTKRIERILNEKIIYIDWHTVD